MSNVRYEVWFKNEPYYFSSASKKTFKMWLKTRPQDILRFKRIEK